MSTKQEEKIRVRIIYNLMFNSDTIGELHVFFHESRMPIEGEKIYLENEFTEGIFLPKGKNKHKTEGQLKILKENFRIHHWIVIKINKDDPNIWKINIEIDEDKTI